MFMVTLKHIAEQAGVTVSVVSRALNPRPDKHARVAPDTKSRIEDVARTLGFRRNRAAEFLKRGRSPVVQVYLPPFTNERTADLVMGIAEAAEQEDFSLGFHCGANAGQFNDFLNKASSNRTCGVLCCQHYLEANFWDQVQPDIIRDIKMVAINPVGELPAHCPSVSVGFYEAGAVAARRLIEKGCTSLAVIGTAKPRLAGFMQAARESSLTPRAFLSSQADELLAWIRESPGPVGVFAVTDILAFKLISRLSAAGIRVPDDVRVVGHDDRDFGLHLDPALTTIRHQYRQAGREGLHILIRQIYGESVNSRTIPPSLVARESA